MSKQKSKSQSAGKRFEGDFKASVPSSSLLIRLNDSPQVFNKSNMTRFTHRTPCDFILFDCNHHVLVPIELKTTKYKSMSYEDISSDDNQTKMIHRHQIIGLSDFSKYDNVSPCFLFNFRDEKTGIERCYCQRIEDFLSMILKLNKKSFNELDLLTIGNVIKVNGELKRSHYRWDISKLLDDIDNKFYNK